VGSRRWATDVQKTIDNKEIKYAISYTKLYKIYLR
jgi:hypothetical protein